MDEGTFQPASPRTGQTGAAQGKTEMMWTPEVEQEQVLQSFISLLLPPTVRCEHQLLRHAMELTAAMDAASTLILGSCQCWELTALPVGDSVSMAVFRRCSR